LNLASARLHTRIAPRLALSHYSKMTWLQFLSSVTSSVAWPLVVLAIAFILRRELVALFERIAEISLPGGYKVVFSKSLKEAQAAVAQISEESKFKGRAMTRDAALEYLFSDESMRDSLSLMSQMLNVYGHMITLLMDVRSIIEKPDLRDPEDVVRELVRQNLVSPSFLSAFENIRKARNALVHLDERDLDVQEAIQFVSQASSLIQYLETLINQKVPPKRG
jgi:uncharacterized protein YutE (UPF0331/DUF86 family)